MVDDLWALEEDTLELHFIEDVSFREKHSLAGRDIPALPEERSSRTITRAPSRTSSRHRSEPIAPVVSASYKHRFTGIAVGIIVHVYVLSFGQLDLSNVVLV